MFQLYGKVRFICRNVREIKNYGAACKMEKKFSDSLSFVIIVFIIAANKVGWSIPFRRGICASQKISFNVSEILKKSPERKCIQKGRETIVSQNGNHPVHDNRFSSKGSVKRSPVLGSKVQFSDPIIRNSMAGQ